MEHTVLVVEDEENLREMTCEVLTGAGYTVVGAADGQEALDRLPAIPHVCLVLLDLLMPGMNGWDFFAALKARAEYGGVPVVIVSSAPEQAPKGATRVLQKPVRLERLLATVRELCAH